MVEPKRKQQQPSKPQGFAQMIPSLLVMVGIQHGCYLIIKMAFEEEWTNLVGLPQLMSDETCQQQQRDDNNERCGRGDLFAFQCVSGLVFWLCGIVGIYVFHFDKSLPKASTNERLFGYHPLASEITKLNLAYQIWDILISLTIPENCDLIMMTHHSVTAYLCYSGISNNMLGYYATFFLGISEVSSIFLVLLECAKYFEPTAVGYPYVKLLGMAASGAFVVTFILYRVVLWWPTSLRLMGDVFSDTAAGTVEQMRALRTWLCFNLPMGCLQLYWLVVILGKAKAIILP